MIILLHEGHDAWRPGGAERHTRAGTRRKERSLVFLRGRKFTLTARRARQGPPPEVDIAAVSDQELVDIVHEVREEMWGDA